MPPVFDLGFDALSNTARTSVPLSQTMSRTQRLHDGGLKLRKSARTRELQLLALAAMCNAWLGPHLLFPVFANTGPSNHRLQHRVQSQAGSVSFVTPGRVIDISAERTQDLDVPGATVNSMDRLMREDAFQVLAAGAERVATINGSDDTWYAFMPPTKMGPWTNQVRLTCKLRRGGSGVVHVDISDFAVAVNNGTGLGKFEKFEESVFSMKWMNRLSWQMLGDSLKLTHVAEGHMTMALPWWFPLPDALVRSTAAAGVSFMLKDGQTKIGALIKQRMKASVTQKLRI